MLKLKYFSIFVIILFCEKYVCGSIIHKGRDIPPEAKYGYEAKISETSAQRFKSWTPTTGDNIWEHSGLLEGDIMTYERDTRNGILNHKKYWPKGIVPFYIDEQEFNQTQTVTILKGFKEYHNKTCIRFRPYQKGDSNWINIKGSFGGCWSSVGMQEDGQVVNLNTPKCVQHGVVVHEVLHALGFYHQQSSSDRDDYVRILWENILKGTENNFNKYNDSIVTSYGVEYDYGSVMHYGATAFSKNGQPTIEALKCGVTLGQRVGLSNSDVIKLNKMYSEVCARDDPSSGDMDNTLNELIELFDNEIELNK